MRPHIATHCPQVGARIIYEERRTAPSPRVASGVIRDILSAELRDGARCGLQDLRGEGCDRQVPTDPEQHYSGHVMRRSTAAASRHLIRVEDRNFFIADAPSGDGPAHLFEQHDQPRLRTARYEAGARRGLDSETSARDAAGEDAASPVPAWLVASRVSEASARVFRWLACMFPFAEHASEAAQ